MNKLTYLLYTLIFVLLYSCSTIDYTSYNIITASKIDIKQSKWIIDEPVTNIASHYSNDIIERYKKKLNKNFGLTKSIRDFKNISTMNRFLKSDLKMLIFYEEQTSYDYLIETEVKTVKNDLPNFQLYPEKRLADEMYIRIMVYDLKNKILIHDKEFYFNQTFEGGNNIAFSKTTDKFYKRAINTAINEFGKKYNWKLK